VPDGYDTAIKTVYVQSQCPPVIDPDVIGPDDFRVPIPKAQASDPDQPFDVWLRRRNWIDAQLQNLQKYPPQTGGVQSVLAGMLQPWIYVAGNVTTILTPWTGATLVSPSSFETIWENLAEGGGGVEAIGPRLGADLGLTIDSFNRLMDILHQDLAAVLDSRNPPVTAEAWNELYSLLVQAAKTRFFPAWRAEEAALPLIFGSQDFVVSVREPAVGNWPLVMPPGQPLIDPALVGITDLPEWTAGAQAVKFWRQRSKQVAALWVQIRGIRESSGFQAALNSALGSAPPPPDLDTLAANLVSSDPATAAGAAATLQSTLVMSVDDFNELLAIRAEDADPNSSPPTPAQWTELYNILTSASTHKNLYPVWVSQEHSAGLVYWTACKAALPLWRSNADDRMQWHAGLAQRSGPPIIDPDLLNYADFADPVTTNPAFQIWHQRSSSLNTWMLSWPPVTATTYESSIQELIGVTSAHLLAIAKQSANGTDITGVLAQLGLTSDAFSAVVGTVNLLQGGLPLLASEQSDFNSILAQVWKQRQFAAWRLQEAASNIVLGPDRFQLSSATSNGSSSCSCSSAPSTSPVPPALPEWRATQAARQAWEDTLNSRIEQQSTTVTALENVADSSEGATLTQLRDALVMATNAPGSDLGSKADWLTENLMIDAETGGCQKTTRIEQALETLQTVMTSVRNGQIGSFDLQLASAPAAISAMGPNRIDVFAMGDDNALWHKFWDGTSGGPKGTWNDWESLGGNLTSGPAVTTHGYGTIDVFVRGADDALWYLGYAGGWQNWQSFGGVLASRPAAASQELGSFDIFAIGTDGGLWQLSGSTDPVPGLKLAPGGQWRAPRHSPPAVSHQHLRLWPLATACTTSSCAEETTRSGVPSSLEHGLAGPRSSVS
jgi:hypothetical protein